MQVRSHRPRTTTRSTWKSTLAVTPVTSCGIDGCGADGLYGARRVVRGHAPSLGRQLPGRTAAGLCDELVHEAQLFDHALGEHEGVEVHQAHRSIQAVQGHGERDPGGD